MLSVRILAVVSALLFVAMAIYTYPLKPGIPVLQLTFSEVAFRSILSEWTPFGVEIFKRHFLIDFPFLVCYGCLGYLLSTQTHLFERFAPAAKSLLALALPAAAVADATENAFHLTFLFGAGPFTQVQYFAAGVAASTKWLLILAFIGSALYAKLKAVD